MMRGIYLISFDNHFSEHIFPYHIITCRPYGTYWEGAVF